MQQVLEMLQAQCLLLDPLEGVFMDDVDLVVVEGEPGQLGEWGLSILKGTREQCK